jgi:hypothetical protein
MGRVSQFVAELVPLALRAKDGDLAYVRKVEAPLLAFLVEGGHTRRSEERPTSRQLRGRLCQRPRTKLERGGGSLALATRCI